MRKHWQQRLRLKYGVSGMLPVVLLTSMVGVCRAQEPEQDLPVVLEAAVPFYPRNAQMAHIEGVVLLQVTTDGEAVSGVELFSGPLILAMAAKENVKTWRLQFHSRTTFVATFRYRLLPEFVCAADDGTVVLRLPLEVEVSTKGIKTCDPSIEVKSKKNAR